jgi:hypothetical protein
MTNLHHHCQQQRLQRYHHMKVKDVHAFHLFVRGIRLEGVLSLDISSLAARTLILSANDLLTDALPQTFLLKLKQNNLSNSCRNIAIYKNH